MSDDLLDWPEEIYDGEDIDDIDLDLYIQPKKLKAARARRKLETHWERKRLAENLYDVFADDKLSHNRQTSVAHQDRRKVRLLQNSVANIARKQNLDKRYAFATYGHSEVA